MRPICAIFGFLICLALPAMAEPPLTVEIVTARATTDVRHFSLTGEIQARDTLTVSFPTGGRVADVLVQEGDKVSAGAVLARMESVQQQQALRAAEAGLSTAQADFRQASEDLDRQVALLERGATTRIERDSAEDAKRIADGVLAQARADLDRAKKALADTVLTAPQDATVTDRLAEPGQVVGAAQPVLDLALGAALDAVFDVPEALLTAKRPSPQVTLTLLDHPQDEFYGVVREVSPLINPQSGTVSVTVSVVSPPPAVSYRDAVRGSVTRDATSRVSLPYTAMTATKDGPAVWVVDPETMAVSIRPVQIDRFETGKIVLASGVADGTLVVTQGAQLLFPGRVVKMAESAQ